MRDQANERQEAGPIELGTGTQFWVHADYGVVLVAKRVTPHGYWCRVNKQDRAGHVLWSDAVIPRWELVREVTEEEWQKAGGELEKQEAA
jgi:hypothetical protein